MGSDRWREETKVHGEFRVAWGLPRMERRQKMHRGLELFAKLPLLPHDFRLRVSLRTWGPHLQTVIKKLQQ